MTSVWDDVFPLIWKRSIIVFSWKFDVYKVTVNFFHNTSIIGKSNGSCNSASPGVGCYSQNNSLFYTNTFYLRMLMVKKKFIMYLFMWLVKLFRLMKLWRWTGHLIFWIFKSAAHFTTRYVEIGLANIFVNHGWYLTLYKKQCIRFFNLYFRFWAKRMIIVLQWC